MTQWKFCALVWLKAAHSEASRTEFYWNPCFKRGNKISDLLQSTQMTYMHCLSSFHHTLLAGDLTSRTGSSDCKEASSSTRHVLKWNILMLKLQSLPSLSCREALSMLIFFISSCLIMASQITNKNILHHEHSFIPIFICFLFLPLSAAMKLSAATSSTL